LSYMNSIMALIAHRNDIQSILAKVSFGMMVYSCLFAAIFTIAFLCFCYFAFANQVLNSIHRTCAFGVGMAITHFAIISHFLNVITQHIVRCCFFALGCFAVIRPRCSAGQFSTRRLFIGSHSLAETLLTFRIPFVKFIQRFLRLAFSANFRYVRVRHNCFLIKQLCLGPIAGHVPVVGSLYCNHSKYHVNTFFRKEHNGF